MNNKETTWRDDEALKRFQLISPLMDETLDLAKKLTLRKQISEAHNVSLRSLYRYEKTTGNRALADLNHRSGFNPTCLTISRHLFRNVFF